MNELLAQASAANTKYPLLTLGPDPLSCVTIEYSVTTQTLQ